MRILVACEFSGTIREAFTKLGHDAWSCDLEPSEKPGKHLQCDVRDILYDKWDAMIAHPPCTYLATMGVWWNRKRPERWPLTIAAKIFVELLWNSGIPKIAIENPVGYLNRNFCKPSQIINPWQFGHEASKPTCLWLRGFPLLQGTRLVGKGRFYYKANGIRTAAWSHITSGKNKVKRAKIASRTFPGIAEAMALQWGGVIVDDPMF